MDIHFAYIMKVVYKLCTLKLVDPLDGDGRQCWGDGNAAMAQWASVAMLAIAIAHTFKQVRY